MLMPSIIDDNLFDDWFDDDFYMPYVPDMSRVDKKLYGNKAAREMKTDVKETDQGYEVAVDLPGVKKEDVKAELKDGYLVVSAKHGSSKDEKNSEGKYIRRERYYGSASRSFYVGEQVKQEDIKARFENGILNLWIPKIEKQPQVEQNRYIVIEG